VINGNLYKFEKNNKDMVFVLDDIDELGARRAIDSEKTIAHECINPTESDQFWDHWRFVEFALLTLYSRIVKGYEWENLLGEFKKPLDEALWNAAGRGNREDPKNIVRTALHAGEHGGYMYVKDEGPGFDFLRQIRLIRQGDRHYHQNEGVGLMRFHKTPLHVAFHEGGSAVSIATPYSK
tara:strand:- start:3682 stop:4221 length:540 start_codon:yes stop_codon:yes gene_type:complete